MTDHVIFLTFDTESESKKKKKRKSPGQIRHPKLLHVRALGLTWFSHGAPQKNQRVLICGPRPKMDVKAVEQNVLTAAIAEQLLLRIAR